MSNTKRAKKKSHNFSLNQVIEKESDLADQEKAKQLEKYSFASAVENSAKSPRGSKDTSRGGGGKSSDSILEIGTTATGTTSDEILDAFEGCSIKNSTASVSQSVVMYEKSFRSNLKSIPAVGSQQGSSGDEAGSRILRYLQNSKNLSGNADHPLNIKGSLQELTELSEPILQLQSDRCYMSKNSSKSCFSPSNNSRTSGSSSGGLARKLFMQEAVSPISPFQSHQIKPSQLSQTSMMMSSLGEFSYPFSDAVSSAAEYDGDDDRIELSSGNQSTSTITSPYNRSSKKGFVSEKSTPKKKKELTTSSTDGSNQQWPKFKINRVLKPIVFENQKSMSVMSPSSFSQSEQLSFSVASNSLVDEDKKPRRVLRVSNSSVSINNNNNNNHNSMQSASSFSPGITGLHPPVKLPKFLEDMKKVIVDVRKFDENNGGAATFSVGQAEAVNRETKLTGFSAAIADTATPAPPPVIGRGVGTKGNSNKGNLNGIEIDSDLSNRLTNSLELLSLHRSLGKPLGKVIADYSFDMNKMHFAVPQRVKENQSSSNNNGTEQQSQETQAYGSIALLDKIVEVSDPIDYLRFGINEEAQSSTASRKER